MKDQLTILLIILCPLLLFSQQVEVVGEFVADSIDVQSGLIKNVADPVSTQDAATKAYVDNLLLSFGASIGSAGIQGLLNAGYSPSVIISNGAPLTDFIGLNHEGGIIFYMDPSGDGTGLVSAAMDQSTGAQWGCSGTDLPNVTNVTSLPPIGSGAEIGDGSTNTSNIIVDCPTAPAALACTQYNGGGFSDWFLPSAGELNEMYLKIGQGAGSPNTNIGNFGASFYWSSSEFADNFAWGQYFTVGDQNGYFKVNSGRVRAIRAF